MQKNSIVVSIVVFIALSGCVKLNLIGIENGVTKCVPFAQKEVPDENDGNWESVAYAEGYAIEIYYYEHKKQKVLAMGVHYYFGQLAFKAWACNNSSLPADSKNPKDREDHVVAIWKDGLWFKTYAQRPQREFIKNANGEIIGVKIRLLDDGGKVIVERTVNRLN